MNAGNWKSTVPIPENRNHLWSNQLSILMILSSCGAFSSISPRTMEFSSTMNCGSSVSPAAICADMKALFDKATSHGWRLGCRVRHRQFFFNDLFVRLRKCGSCLNAQAACVVKQFIDALVRNLSVKQFADTRLRFSEDHLQFLLRILLRVLQNCLIQFCLELQRRCMFRREAEIIEHVPPRYMRRFASCVFHVSSPLPNAPSRL